MKAITRSLATSARRAVRPLTQSSRIASWFFVSFIALAVVWDVYLALDVQESNTWSEALRTSSREIILLPWLLGAAAFHLVQPQALPLGTDPDVGSLLMLALTLALALASFLPLALPPVGIAACALLGMVASALLWPGAGERGASRP